MRVCVCTCYILSTKIRGWTAYEYALPFVCVFVIMSDHIMTIMSKYVILNSHLHQTREFL